MGTVSSLLIGALTQNIMSGLGQFFGLSGDKKDSSLVLQALGVGGVGSIKYLYLSRDFKYELTNYPGFNSYISKMLRKRKCPYSLDRLLTMSNSVLIQVNKSSNKGSIIFIGHAKYLIYNLILIGADLIRVKDEMEILASGGSDF